MSIEAELDRLPVQRFHWRVTLVTGLGWMFDAMDVTLIAFIVVALRESWRLGPDQVRWVLVMGFIGMFVGAALAGALADRYGRRPLLILTLLLFSIATGLSAFAPTLLVMYVLRFLAGLGLGGELPIASTLVAELAPAAQRGRLVVILESFWAWGSILAALIAFLLIPRFGWQAGFLAGALPAFYAFYLRRHLPESPRFLLRAGRAQEAAVVLRQMGVSATGQQLQDAIGHEPPGSALDRFRQLWAPAQRRRTLLLWVLWFGMVYAFYGITAWLPTLLAGQGYPLTQTFGIVLIMTLAQVPGYVTAAWLVDRVGRKWTLVGFLALYGAAALFLGQYGFVRGATLTEVVIWGALVQFFSLGAWGVIYTYTPELYPTAIRGTGSGWAAAVGRLGGIVGPFVVPWLLDPAGALRLDARLVLTMFAGVLAVVTGMVALLGEETRGRSLEHIAGEADDAGAGSRARRRHPSEVVR
jgi:putative MFS transporter